MVFDPDPSLLREVASRVVPRPAKLPPFVRWAKVVSTTVGPPKSLGVQIAGSTTTVAGVRYANAYTPAVNDIVFGLQVGPDFIVLDKLA